MNTSATGGYLAPAAPAPAYDAALVRLLHDAVTGITGLDGRMVRPRWQPEPPNQPGMRKDWAALGVTLIRADGGPYTRAGNTALTVTRWETLDVDVSFYGPRREELAALLRDGLDLSQNRAALRRAGIAVADVDAALNAPALINGQWQHRADLALTLRREVRRDYPVLSFIAFPVGGMAEGSQVHDLNLGCPPEH